MTRILTSLLTASAALALAQDLPAPTAPAPTKPLISKLDDARYLLGGITINQQTREIRFPSKVNMAEGLLEYLLCQQQGKVHEALLVTDISPTHLALVFTLLRYPTSNELFALVDESGHPTGQFPAVPAATKAGARITIDVEWDEHGTRRRQPVNQWLQHAVKNAAMAAGPWLYTGADFADGKFIPEITGDIAAIMLVPTAMINFPGSDNDDNVWFAYPQRVPPEGTPVTLIITPFSNTKAPAKP